MKHRIGIRRAGLLLLVLLRQTYRRGPQSRIQRLSVDSWQTNAWRKPIIQGNTCSTGPNRVSTCPIAAAKKKAPASD
jgi:hypothetical protein